MRVPEVVKPDLRKLGLLDRPPERAAHALRVKGLAVFSCEHVPRVAPDALELVLIRDLPRGLGLEDLDRPGVQSDGTSPFGRLRLADDDAVAMGDEGASH